MRCRRCPGIDRTRNCHQGSSASKRHLPESPVDGWRAYLSGRGIEILTDDIGRDAISRADARQLFDEHRAAEERRREVAERQERQAIEADRLWRSRLSGGVPASMIPEGATYAALVRQAELDALPKRTSVLEEALGGGGVVYHPLPKGDES
jgi:hypothetical protein